MIEFLLTILTYSSIFIQFLPLLLLFFIKNKDLITMKRALILFCAINIIADIVGVIVAPIYKNNNPIYHIYTLTAGVTILYMYFIIIQSERIRKYILIVAALFSTFSIFFFFYKDGYKLNNAFSNITLCLIMMILSIYYFYTIFVELKIKVLKNYYFFWINSAFLIYYGTTFYLSIFENSIRSVTYDLYDYLWPIQLIATIILNLILAKGIWKMKK